MAAVTTEVYPIDWYRIVPDGVSLMMITLPLGDRSKGELLPSDRLAQDSLLVDRKRDLLDGMAEFLAKRRRGQFGRALDAARKALEEIPVGGLSDADHRQLDLRSGRQCQRACGVARVVGNLERDQLAIGSPALVGAHREQHRAASSATDSRSSLSFSV